MNQLTRARPPRARGAQTADRRQAAEGRGAGPSRPACPLWAQGLISTSYARHIFRTTGCRKLVLYSQYHNVPDLRSWREGAGAAAAGPAPLDLEAAGTYGPRVKLGEFACDEF